MATTTPATPKKRKLDTLDHCPHCNVAWPREWRRSFSAHVPRCYKRPCPILSSPETQETSSQLLGSEIADGIRKDAAEGELSEEELRLFGDDSASQESTLLSMDLENDAAQTLDTDISNMGASSQSTDGGKDAYLNEEQSRDDDFCDSEDENGNEDTNSSEEESSADSLSLRRPGGSFRSGKCSERVQRGLRLAHNFMEKGLQGVLDFLHTEAPSLNISRSVTTILRHQARLVDESDFEEVELIVPESLRSVLGPMISFPMLRHPWREISAAVRGHEGACVFQFESCEHRSEFWHGCAWRRAQDRAGGDKASIAPVTIWHDGTLVTSKTSATCVVVEPAFLPQSMLRGGRFLVPVAVMPQWEAAAEKALKTSLRSWEIAVKSAEQWLQGEVLHRVVQRVINTSPEEIMGLLRAACPVVPCFLAALGDSKELHGLLGLYAAGSASRCPCRMCYVTRNETNCFDPESWAATHAGSWIAQEACARQQRVRPSNARPEASEHAMFTEGRSRPQFLHPRETPYDLLHTLGEWPKLAVTLTYELVGKVGGRRKCLELDAVIKSLTPRKPAPSSWVRWSSNYQIEHLFGKDGRSTKAFIYTREWPSIALIVALAFLSKPRFLAGEDERGTNIRAIVLDALTGAAGSFFDCHRREWTSACIDQVTASLCHSARSLVSLWALVQETSGKGTAGAPFTAIKLHAPPAHFWSQLQDYATLIGTDTERHEAWNKRAKMAWRRMAKVHAGTSASSKALLRKLLIFRRQANALTSESGDGEAVMSSLKGRRDASSSSSSSPCTALRPPFVPPGSKAYELRISNEDFTIPGRRSVREEFGERVNWSALLQSKGVPEEELSRVRGVSKLTVSYASGDECYSFTLQSRMLGGERSFVHVQVEVENEPPSKLVMDVLAVMSYEGSFYLLGFYLQEAGWQEQKQRLEGAPRQWSLLRYEVVKGQLQADCIPASATTLSPACIVRLEKGQSSRARRFLKMPREYFRREPGDALEWTDRTTLSRDDLYEKRRSSCIAADEGSKLWSVAKSGSRAGTASTGWLRENVSNLTKVATPAASAGMEKLFGYSFPFKMSPNLIWRATIVGLLPSGHSKGEVRYIAELEDGSRVEVREEQVPQDATPPRFQKWWHRRVAKSFVDPGVVDGSVSTFIGCVQPHVRFERSCNGAFLEPFFQIVYNDGDLEEMDASEVERRLLPSSKESTTASL